MIRNMKLEKGQESVQYVFNLILNILKNNTLMSLSTQSEEQLWTSCVFYSYDVDEVKLYFVSSPESIHCKMIHNNSHVSGAIYSTEAVWGTNIQGIQFKGKAELVPAYLAILKGGNYLKRFPIAKKFISSPEIFLDKLSSVRLYCIDIELIQLYDEVNLSGEDCIRRIIFQ